jgi:hypothetical protein
LRHWNVDWCGTICKSTIRFHWLSAALVCASGISSFISCGASIRLTTKSAKWFRARSNPLTCQRRPPNTSRTASWFWWWLCRHAKAHCHLRSTNPT